MNFFSPGRWVPIWFDCRKFRWSKWCDLCWRICTFGFRWRLWIRWIRIRWWVPQCDAISRNFQKKIDCVVAISRNFQKKKLIVFAISRNFQKNMLDEIAQKNTSKKFPYTNIKPFISEESFSLLDNAPNYLVGCVIQKWLQLHYGTLSYTLRWLLCWWWRSTRLYYNRIQIEDYSRAKFWTSTGWSCYSWTKSKFAQLHRKILFIFLSKYFNSEVYYFDYDCIRLKIKIFSREVWQVNLNQMRTTLYKKSPSKLMHECQKIFNPNRYL